MKATPTRCASFLPADKTKGGQLTLPDTSEVDICPQAQNMNYQGQERTDWGS
jgi:hypothetical protein